MARIEGSGRASYLVVSEAEMKGISSVSAGYLTPKGLNGLELYEYALGPKLASEFVSMLTVDPAKILGFIKSHERQIAKLHPGYSIHDEGFLDPDEAVNLASARLKDLGVPHTTIVGPVKNGASTGVWILWEGRWLSGVRNNEPPAKAIRELAERDPKATDYEFTSE